MQNFNILSIDGGGIKGIISAIVLRDLEQYIQTYSHNPSAHLSDYFDLIAGTSTGSILTGLYLCPDKDGKAKYSAQDAYELYKELGSTVFKKKMPYQIKSIFGLIRSKYDNKKLYELLEKSFQDVKISELLKPCLITAYDLDRESAYFFNTESAKMSKEKNFYLRDAILSSTAAPTFFPSVQIESIAKRQFCMIDGGVCCNNPSMCAFAEAIKMPAYISIDKINIFSVGNLTKHSSSTCQQVQNRGLVGWVSPFIDITLSANTQTVDYQLKMLFNTLKTKDNYIRIDKLVCDDFNIPSLDASSKKDINLLIHLGEQLAYEWENDIKNFAYKLVYG